MDEKNSKDCCGKDCGCHDKSSEINDADFIYVNPPPIVPHTPPILNNFKKTQKIPTPISNPRIFNFQPREATRHVSKPPTAPNIYPGNYDDDNYAYFWITVFFGACVLILYYVMHG